MSKHEGCVTEMLPDLGLQSLEATADVSVQAGGKTCTGNNIEHDKKSQRPKRTVRAQQYTDFVTKKTLWTIQCVKNQCFKPIQARAKNLRYSFFVSTVYDWNHLDHKPVNSNSIEIFKTTVAKLV